MECTGESRYGLTWSFEVAFDTLRRKVLTIYFVSVLTSMIEAPQVEVYKH